MTSPPDGPAALAPGSSLLHATHVLAQAALSGRRTSFDQATFRGRSTSFDSPQAWTNVYFDGDRFAKRKER